ncbi:MAG TPA: MOSC domain-containing protein [Candidatus Binataceae bacterium]|nr:MOSC domain-containing protein [Candidatus Binataceae bacterium]
MGELQVGTVGGLFRYPVKSMLGETLSELTIGPAGVVGDRAWALRELVNGRIVSAKKWRQAFDFRAAYAAESAAPIITLPDGRKIAADAPEASQLISAAFGHKLELAHAEADQTLRASFDPAMVFGDVPLEQMMPVLQKYHPPDAGPDYWGMPPGTFFDAAPLHILTTGTLAHLGRLNRESHFDARRFRPNILIDTGAGADRFIEDDWLTGRLRLGEVTIAVTAPVVRCVMTTHEQDDLPRDLAVLRTAASHHSALVGAYAAVEQPGRVRVGDSVALIR